MQFVKISVQKDQTLTGEQASSTSGKIQERDVNFLHQAREGRVKSQYQASFIQPTNNVEWLQRVIYCSSSVIVNTTKILRTNIVAIKH